MANYFGYLVPSDMLQQGEAALNSTTHANNGSTTPDEIYQGTSAEASTTENTAGALING